MNISGYTKNGLWSPYSANFSFNSNKTEMQIQELFDWCGNYIPFGNNSASFCTWKILKLKKKDIIIQTTILGNVYQAELN
jgi:hypothetical protein